MHLLVFVLMLQTTKNSAQITTPATNSVPKATTEASAPPIGHQTRTTPNLSLDSGIAHFEMGRELGIQGEAMGELKAKVAGLEEKREKSDRPDIDDLKSTQLHVIWTASLVGVFLSGVGSIVWFLRKVIWQDVLKHRIKKQLAQLSN